MFLPLRRKRSRERTSGFHVEPRLERGAPTALRPVDRAAMSIEKESSGLPEVDVKRRTTKVNLSIVIGVLLFFVTMGAVVWWFWFTRS